MFSNLFVLKNRKLFSKTVVKYALSFPFFHLVDNQSSFRVLSALFEYRVREWSMLCYCLFTPCWSLFPSFWRIVWGSYKPILQAQQWWFLLWLFGGGGVRFLPFPKYFSQTLMEPYGGFIWLLGIVGKENNSWSYYC